MYLDSWTEAWGASRIQTPKDLWVTTSATATSDTVNLVGGLCEMCCSYDTLSIAWDAYHPHSVMWMWIMRGGNTVIPMWKYQGDGDGCYFFAAMAHSPSHFRPSENDSLLIHAMPGGKNCKWRLIKENTLAEDCNDIEQQSLVLPLKIVFGLRRKDLTVAWLGKL